MSTPDLSPPQQVTEADHVRRLRNGLISIAVLVVLVVGLLLAVPGLHGVGHVVTHMTPAWLAAAVALEVASCLGYIVIFLAVFKRAPLVFGARVALTEMAFGAAVSLGGAGSIAVGAWLLHERGVPVGQVAERASSRGESHPPALSEPGVSLSTHRAPIIQPSGDAPACQWAKRPGSRAATLARNIHACLRCRRSRLYFCVAHRTR
jgi:hypothetical protein